VGTEAIAMSKYAPLTDYLFNIAADCDEIEMTFTEIEQILGTELPITAKSDRTWWANTQRSNHAKRWLKVGWKIFRVDFKNEIIVFRRFESDNEEATENIRLSGYAKLKAFFENLPTKQKQIALYFSELSEIIGKKLPTTAFHDRPWWANTHASIQGSSWLSAGWHVDNVYLGANVVVFRKRGDNPVKRIPKYVKHLLDKNTSIKLVDSQTIIRWINFCKKTGWYFEGTVLYERAGISTESLSEIEQVAMEEDYATCKRELNLYRSILKHLQ